jgi:MFS family permease
MQWSLKLCFGFLSDTLPIAGMRRKPYFAIGTLLFSIAYISYGVIGVHNVVLLAVTTFVGTIGMIMFDVMADTMCVERSKFEPENAKVMRIAIMNYCICLPVYMFVCLYSKL